MSDEQQHCDGPGIDVGTECGRELAGHGRGKCQTHLKQLQRNGVMEPIAEKLSPKEHLLNLVNRWVEADGDEEYEAAERAVIAQAKTMGRKSLTASDVADLVKDALSNAARRRVAAAKARGSRYGRPPVAVDKAVLSRLLSHFKNPVDVAFALGVSRATIYRILKRTTFETAQQTTPAGSPRTGGGSA